MIPRYQRILFAVLLGSSIVMAVFLIFLHRKNFSEVKNADNSPLEAPAYSAAEDATLLLANDADGNIHPVTRLLALPQTPAVRARALLEHLLSEYALPRAQHSVGGGAAIEDVYLVQLPLAGPSAAKTTDTPAITGTIAANSSNAPTQGTGQLAIVNLRSGWVDAHPPGITAETLTIASIVGTLHANLPDVTAVRFLVDGKPRATLAGSVELDRTYDATDTVQP